MSNVCANETLDAMCAVCGAHCATWVGEDEHGNREYILGNNNQIKRITLSKTGPIYSIRHRVMVRTEKKPISSGDLHCPC